MERDADRVLELFISAVDQAGGAGRILREGRGGWLPAFMESAYALLLQDEEHRQPEEIADILGVTREAVESILSGPADIPLARIGEAPPDDELIREHLAGGFVRHLWAQRAPLRSVE